MSTIYKFNTSSEFRGFTYNLNFLMLVIHLPAFRVRIWSAIMHVFISLCHKFIFTMLIVYICILLYHYDFILLVKNEK